MTDYKELIAELRKCKYCAPTIAQYAADAIEELARDIEVLTKERNAAFKCIEDIESALEYGYATDIRKVIREWRGG